MRAWPRLRKKNGRHLVALDEVLHRTRSVDDGAEAPGRIAQDEVELEARLGVEVGVAGDELLRARSLRQCRVTEVRAHPRGGGDPEKGPAVTAAKPDTAPLSPSRSQKGPHPGLRVPIRAPGGIRRARPPFPSAPRCSRRRRAPAPRGLHRRTASASRRPAGLVVATWHRGLRFAAAVQVEPGLEARGAERLLGVALQAEVGRRRRWPARRRGLAAVAKRSWSGDQRVLGPGSRSPPPC